MDKIKNKYEVILGFATLFISLSAFKDDLQKVKIDLGFVNFTLAEYFLYCVYGFSISLYLYVIENILRDTKIGSWKIFDWILKFAYLVFLIVLSSPIVIILLFLVSKVYYSISPVDSNLKTNVLTVIAVILSSISIIYNLVSTIRIFKTKKEKIIQNIEEREIIELERATKLLNDGYFSQSILESFKLLENHLFKTLTTRDIRVPTQRFNDLLRMAFKYEIISQVDFAQINELRKLRNSAAHSTSPHTKEQAEFAISFVKDLLMKNGS